MDQIIQIFEILKTFAKSFFAGWNLPVAVSLLTASVFGTVYGVKAIRKLRFQVYNIRYKRKLSNIERKVKDYTLTKDPKNLMKNLNKREKLRIKAAKRGVFFKSPSLALRSDATLNNVTFAQPTLSKTDRKQIIRDAKLNIYKVKGKSDEYMKKSKKWGFDSKKEMLESDGYHYTQSIMFGGHKIELPSNSIFAKSPVVVKNYERDVNLHDSTFTYVQRSGGRSIAPMVLEITDEQNNEIFRLSDVSPKRFYDYSIDGYAYLNQRLMQNMQKEEKDAKAYRVVFYDTAQQKNVKQMDTLIKSTADLHTFAEQFDWNFAQIKPKVNIGHSREFSQKIEEKTNLYQYEQKIENKEANNSFIYSKNLSRNLKSKALEDGFNKIVETNKYSNPDPEPQISSFLINDKEVFKTKVESKDLFKVTDPVVDAYILALMSKRILSGMSDQKIVKAVEGYERVYEEKNGNQVLTKKYNKHNKEFKSNNLKELYEKNKRNDNFFPAFLAVAIEFELSASTDFFEIHGIYFSEPEKRLFNTHLAEFQQNAKDNALKLFGILPGKRKETVYQNVKSDVDGFEKATHFQDVVIRNDKEQKITTTSAKLKDDFYDDVKSSTIQIDDVPHTLDIFTKEDKNRKMMFRLGLTLKDADKFKEYFYKIMMEALCLIEDNKVGRTKEEIKAINETPIMLYITFPDKQEKNPHIKEYASVIDLKTEVENMRKEYNYMEMNDFRSKFDFNH